MFSGEIDARLSPYSIRNSGAVVGTLLAIAVAASLISTRTIPFFLAPVVVAAGAFAWREWGTEGLRPQFGPAGAWSLAFLFWAGVSAFWALSPLRTLAGMAGAALIALAVFSSLPGIGREPRVRLVRLAEGLWMGFAVGLAYLLIEQLSGAGLKIWVYNLLGIGPDEVKTEWFTFENGRIAAIDPVELTRNAAPISLFLWPALMSVYGAMPRRAALGVSFALLTAATAAIFFSTHETSKVAIIVGAFVFLAASVSLLWTWRALAAGWVAACLAILPLAWTAYRLDLHNAPWLPDSARHRIIIWNYTAEETLRHPLAGTGALSTYVMGQFLKPQPRNLPGEHYPRTLSQHAHNIYLQTWYELGGVGAVLLGGFGLALIGRLRRLKKEVQPFAAAMFACAIVMAGTSYGFWQTWYLAMYGLAVFAFGVGMAAFETRRRPALLPDGAGGRPEKGLRQ